jgi:hypothetical protein
MIYKVQKCCSDSRRYVRRLSDLKSVTQTPCSLAYCSLPCLSREMSLKSVVVAVVVSFYRGVRMRSSSMNEDRSI